MDFRHELKFLVSDMELEILRYRLRPIMHQDKHQQGNKYTVRSLYFDDLDDSCMRENEDGVDNRYKFRIRLYNGETSLIKLEKKSKLRGMTRKLGVTISTQDCLKYMNGEVVGLRENSSELEKELYAQMKTRGMRPASIVEYERTAFVEPMGNVRVTFDRNLGGSSRINQFLDETVALTPLLPQKQHILEVKYDELLPQYIAEMFSNGTLQRCSYSKYYFSRNIAK